MIKTRYLIIIVTFLIVFAQGQLWIDEDDSSEVVKEVSNSCYSDNYQKMRSYPSQIAKTRTISANDLIRNTFTGMSNIVLDNRDNNSLKKYLLMVISNMPKWFQTIISLIHNVVSNIPLFNGIIGKLFYFLTLPLLELFKSAYSNQIALDLF